MLSLAASFRAAARRQSSRLSPAAMATRATSSSAPQDPDDMNELAAELEAFGAGQAGEDNIIDPVRVSFLHLLPPLRFSFVSSHSLFYWVDYTPCTGDDATVLGTRRKH